MGRKGSKQLSWSSDDIFSSLVTPRLASRCLVSCFSLEEAWTWHLFRHLLVVDGWWCEGQPVVGVGPHSHSFWEEADEEVGEPAPHRLAVSTEPSETLSHPAVLSVLVAYFHSATRCMRKHLSVCVTWASVCSEPWEFVSAVSNSKLGYWFEYDLHVEYWLLWLIQYDIVTLLLFHSSSTITMNNCFRLERWMI